MLAFICILIVTSLFVGVGKSECVCKLSNLVVVMIWQIPIFWGDHKNCISLPFTSLASGERAMMSALAPHPPPPAVTLNLSTFVLFGFLILTKTSVSLDPMLINFLFSSRYLAAGLLSIDLSKLPTQLVTLKLVPGYKSVQLSLPQHWSVLVSILGATGSLNHTNVVSDSNHYQSKIKL